MFFNQFWCEKVFWASKIQAFNISDEGFRKTKNQRPIQGKKEDISEDCLSTIYWDFSPLFFHFLELYDDITRFSIENAVSIAEPSHSA